MKSVWKKGNRKGKVREFENLKQDDSTLAAFGETGDLGHWLKKY